MEIGHCSLSETGFLEAHRLDKETECGKKKKKNTKSGKVVCPPRRHQGKLHGGGDTRVGSRMTVGVKWEKGKNSRLKAACIAQS